MTAAAAAASLASGAFGMMQANYQAKVAEMNQQVAKDNARLASARGGIEAQLNDVAAAQFQADQLTGQAASGVAVSGDSQVRTRNQAKFFANADRARIRENANYEAHGYRVQAANFKAEKANQKLSGIASLVGGVLDAAAIMGQSQSGSKMIQSMLGGATGSSAATTTVPKPTLRPPGVGVAPIPRMRPQMPTIGRTSYNPLLQKKVGYV